MKVSFVDDLDECRSLWRRLVSPEGLFDLWEVRACFQTHYGYRPRFVAAVDDEGPKGLLPLSEIDDHGYWGYFPGETYAGKTWLEQNRIVADDTATLRSLLSACPASTHLRYLPDAPLLHEVGGRLDEIGYLFYPSVYGCCFERYLDAFSKSSRKRLGREREGLEAQGVSYRYDVLQDVEKAFALNLDAFGANSYFADDRFLASFRRLAQLLRNRGWLRVTTLLVGGRVAAIDLGAVYNGVYTLLAGGTDPDLRGVAKLINFHHIEWACRQRLRKVDFLCGDFGWKERFHLTARPLYQVGVSPIRTEAAACREDSPVEVA